MGLYAFVKGNVLLVKFATYYKSYMKWFTQFYLDFL